MESCSLVAVKTLLGDNMEFIRSKSKRETRVMLSKHIHIATILPETDHDKKNDRWVVKYPHSNSRVTKDTELEAWELVVNDAIKLSDGIIQFCESDEPRIVEIE